MTEAIAFDTHRFVKNLTASGFTEAQAEALAEEQAHLLNSNLATKADIRGTRVDLERVGSALEVKIEHVKSDLEGKIEQVKSDLEGKIEQVKSDLEVKIEHVKSELEVKIEQVKSELEVKIEQVRAGVETTGAELQRDIENARADLSRWMLTGWIAQTGLIATLFLYLFSVLPGG